MAGEGQNLLTLQQIVRGFGLEIAEEGMEGREALIAGARGPLAFRRRALQEGQQTWDIQLSQVKLVRRDAAMVPAKPEQKLKGVPIRGNRMGTRVTLRGEILG